MGIRNRMYAPNKSERWWVWIDSDEEMSEEDLTEPLLTLPDEGMHNIGAIAEWAARELEDELADRMDWGEATLLLFDATQKTFHRVILEIGGWSAVEDEEVSRESLLPPKTENG